MNAELVPRSVATGNENWSVPLMAVEAGLSRINSVT